MVISNGLAESTDVLYGVCSASNRPITFFQIHSHSHLLCYNHPILLVCRSNRIGLSLTSYVALKRREA